MYCQHTTILKKLNTTKIKVNLVYQKADRLFPGQLFAFQKVYFSLLELFQLPNLRLSSLLCLPYA